MNSPSLKALVGLVAVAVLATPAYGRGKASYAPRIFYRIDGFQQMDEQTQADLTAMAERYLQVAVDNYPFILDTLKVDDRAMPIRTVLIELSSDYPGIAETSGDGNQRTIKKYALKGQDDVGVIVHELTHVVQHYDKGDHPTWIGEGIADYVRWFFYEPDKKRPHIKIADGVAKGSYQKTAAFLFWVASNYDTDLVPKLNWALQNGKYSDQVFQQITGYTLDQLSAYWRLSLDPPK